MPDQTSYDAGRLQELVLYVCGLVEPAKLGAVKLQKTFWFSDRILFAHRGASLTGMTYVKAPQGPFSPKLGKIVKKLQKEGLLVERAGSLGPYAQRQFVPTRAGRLDLFTASEISIVDQVVRAICDGHTATSISDVTHDRIWEIAILGERLPIETVFAAHLADPDPEVAASLIASVDLAEIEEMGMPG